MDVSGKLQLRFNDVVTSGTLAEFGCTVDGGTLETEPLTFTSSVGSGAKETGLKLSPEEGTLFTVLNLNCPEPFGFLSGPYNIEGKWTLNPDGAIWSSSEESEELELNGSKETSLTGSMTVSADGTALALTAK